MRASRSTASALRMPLVVEVRWRLPMRRGEVLGAAARLDEAPDVLGAVGLGVVAAGEPLGAIARDDVLDALVADADRPDGSR